MTQLQPTRRGRVVVAVSAAVAVGAAGVVETSGSIAAAAVMAAASIPVTLYNRSTNNRRNSGRQERIVPTSTDSGLSDLRAQLIHTGIALGLEIGEESDGAIVIYTQLRDVGTPDAPQFVPFEETDR